MKALKHVVKSGLRWLPMEWQLATSRQLINQLIQKSGFDYLDHAFNTLEIDLVKLEDKLRQLSLGRGLVPDFIQPPGTAALERVIMRNDPPWRKTKEFPSFEIPGMLTEEEIQYYHWIARHYSGQYEVVELGPWLGLSTMHLTTALKEKLRESNKQLHVYDDFVWRPGWMNQFLIQYSKNLPAEHTCFQSIFTEYTNTISEFLDIHRTKIADYDGNEHLEQISWSGNPIELMIVDCGRTLSANQGWLDCFSPSFLPNRTLIVMQDWRLHRERPRKHYNQTLLFTQTNPRLELVHEICDGGIATFLYR